jgi:hypothetical protein
VVVLEIDVRGVCLIPAERDPPVAADVEGIPSPVTPLERVVYGAVSPADRTSGSLGISTSAPDGRSRPVVAKEESNSDLHL